MADNLALPATKRRKLQHSTHSWNKPFISPLRSRQTAGKQPNPGDSNAESTKAVLSEAPEPSKEAFQSLPSSSQSYGSSSSSTNNDAAADRSRELRRLEIRIRAVRGDIDILRRAAITASSDECHLQTLTEKWRTVAQNAADELYPYLKDRFIAIGGNAGLRAQGRDDAMKLSDMETPTRDHYATIQEKSFETHDEAGIQRRFIEEHVADMLAKEDEPPAAPNDDQDESFSMQKMLCSLNIDLELIGYDTNTEQWKVAT